MPEKKTESPAPVAQEPTGLQDGRQRAVVDAVLPHVDGGRFPVKRVAGEPFEVTAHCFTDGHDVVRVMLRWRAEEVDSWLASRQSWTAHDARKDESNVEA